MILPVINYFLPVIELRPEMPKARIAVVIGHHPLGKGAFSKHFGQNEYDFYSDVIKLMRSNVDFYKHPSILSYTLRQKLLAKRLKGKGYSVVIELHFNASNGRGNGVECLYYFMNKVGKLYAQNYVNLIVEKTGIKSRGAKALVNSKQRGFGFLKYMPCTALILEPCFGDNESDCKKIGSKQNLANLTDEFIDTL